MGRLILVGEAPGGKSGSLPGPALDVSGGSGRRLAAMMKLSDEEYMALDRRNLFQTTDEGKAWNSQRAHERAGALAHNAVPGDAFVLLGSRVAAAFGLDGYPLFTWLELNPEFPDHAIVSIIPHPSGRNRAYNDSEVYNRACAFLREAVRGVNG